MVDTANINLVNAQLKKESFVILNDLNHQFLANTNYAIVGAMGTGKSTLLNALGGKVFPSQGKINRIKGIELLPSDYSFDRVIGGAFQYYQQRYHAYDSEIGPTLIEVLQGQIKPAGTVDDKSVFLNEPLYSEKHLKKIATLFKLNHLLDRYVTGLSSGETRRSLLAISILKNPKVLVLDNPFVGLDLQSREMLTEILRELTKQQISIILVCGLNDLPDFIDEVLVLGNKTIKSIEKPPFSNLTIEEKKVELNVEELNQVEYTDFNVAIELKKANVVYGIKYALKDFSWAVKKGERWALLGPNGSGKSTVLSLITADNPQAYKNDLVLFDKQRGTGESIWDIKKKIGFVSGELQLYFNKNLRVWKVVASGLFDTMGLYKTLTEEETKTVFSYLRLLKIEHIAERAISQLSAGEQRMVFLARALVKNPPLLILDEPSQGLDYNQMAHFRNVLNEIVLAFNKTLIYVTHYQEEIPACVTKRLYLNEGEVVKEVFN